LTGEKTRCCRRPRCALKDFPGGEVAAPLVVTNEEYRFIIAEQLRQIGVRPPSDRARAGRAQHRAGAHAGRAGRGEEGDPVLLVMPADHVITDQAAFQRDRGRRQGCQARGCAGDLRHRARPAGDRLRLHPQRRRPGGPGGGARALLEFVEKPERATAEAYVDSGAYFWNSGIFMMKASVWNAAIRRFAPEIAAACSVGDRRVQADADFVRLDSAAFERSPSDSIDYAVMEKLAAARPSSGRAWSCRWRPDGPTSARGTRCGRCRPRTTTATRRAARSCSRPAATRWCTPAAAW
jgi:mannose-1-phosphate guanylyltransferase/mannose-6-phosphate isomerase